MVVNEELIAAYIDGNVTVEEREQMRKYFVQHPVERDLAFLLMEGNTSDDDRREQKTEVISKNHESSYADIAYAAAAFAPKVASKAPKGKAKNKIDQRIGNISAFLKELNQND